MRKSLVAIGLSQYGLSILNSLFMFYYVKVFINVFHVNVKWFSIAQTLFAIWNTINDPLFGYLQEIPNSWFHNRLRVIKTFSVFIASSFMFMWIPWDTDGAQIEGIHLIVSLFLFDAFFSAIGVAWGALFAETTKGNAKIRVKALKYSQIAILSSVLAIPFMEYCSESLKNFQNFQIAAAIISIISAGCLWSVKDSGAGKNDEEVLIEKDEKLKEQNIYQIMRSSMSLTTQILSQRQFFAIVLSNFLHTARSVLHMNFAAIITELTIPQSYLPSGSARLSIFFALLIILPQLILIFNERFLAKYGAIRVATASFVVSVASGFLVVFSDNPFCIMAFMLIDCITVHTIAPLFNIILSDFVDEDVRKNHRKSGIPSIIFSLNAVFVKPAQSLAPISAVLVLNSFGYQQYLTSKTTSLELRWAAQMILFLTPMILGSLQLLVLSIFSEPKGGGSKSFEV